MDTWINGRFMVLGFPTSLHFFNHEKNHDEPLSTTTILLVIYPLTRYSPSLTIINHYITTILTIIHHFYQIEYFSTQKHLFF